MIRIFFSLFICLFCLGLHAQSPSGIWKTVDDETDTAKSHIEIFEQDGKFYGKIIKLLDSEPGVVCDNCSGNKKDQPILGMVILESLESYNDYWSSGLILDPENGNEYKCSVWFEEKNTEELKVRGKHWTGLYRTQTWYRVK